MPMYWVSKGSTVYLHVLKNIFKKTIRPPARKKMSMLVEPHTFFGLIIIIIFFFSVYYFYQAWAIPWTIKMGALLFFWVQ